MGRRSSPRRRSTAIVAASLALALASACGRGSELPRELTNQEFWQLFDTFSEPGRSVGMSENFVSNEPRVAENARFLRPSGGVYLGVGPEQNFTYVASLRPRMAFVVDLRRENADLHFLYKAVFELSEDRLDFVSRLFSRPARRSVSRSADIGAIFDAVERVPPSASLLATTTAQVRERLLTTRRLPLEQRDLDAIDRALQAFHDGGPAIDYWRSQAVDKDTLRPSYRRLMTMPDLGGQTRSFLADEASFGFVRNLHQRNLIVPIVGDFGGAQAIRRVGAYVREHHDGIRAFYGSNVAVYLTNQQMRAFCGNLAALPLARGASFVDSKSVIPFGARLEACKGGQAPRP